eukprot:30835-Pelagococcus_subviridis.AAC.2
MDAVGRENAPAPSTRGSRALCNHAVSANDSTLPVANPPITARDSFAPSSPRFPGATNDGPYIMHVDPRCPFVKLIAATSATGHTSEPASARRTPQDPSTTTLHINSGGINAILAMESTTSTHPRGGDFKPAPPVPAPAARRPKKSHALARRNIVGAKRSPERRDAIPAPGGRATHGGAVAGFDAEHMLLVTDGNTTSVTAKVMNTAARYERASAAERRVARRESSSPRSSLALSPPSRSSGAITASSSSPSSPSLNAATLSLSAAIAANAHPAKHANTSAAETKKYPRAVASASASASASAPSSRRSTSTPPPPAAAAGRGGDHRDDAADDPARGLPAHDRLVIPRREERRRREGPALRERGEDAHQRERDQRRRHDRVAGRVVVVRERPGRRQQDRHPEQRRGHAKERRQLRYELSADDEAQREDVGEHVRHREDALERVRERARERGREEPPVEVRALGDEDVPRE